MSSDNSSSDKLLRQLSVNSTPYKDPLARIQWEHLDDTRYWLPPRALSLYGTDSYASLTEAQRIRLSQLEFLHLMEAGLWLEGLFLERASTALPLLNETDRAYVLHEIREEAGHSLMFLELKRHLPVRPWPEHFQRRDLLNFFARRTSVQSSLFWIAKLIGEEVPDRLNRWIYRHGDDICPVIQNMIHTHILDEARHVTYTQERLEQKLRQQGRLKQIVNQRCINLLLPRFIQRLFTPPAGVYEQAGLVSSEHWAQLAAVNPRRRQFITQCLQSALGSLRRHGYKTPLF